MTGEKLNELVIDTAQRMQLHMRITVNTVAKQGKLLYQQPCNFFSRGDHWIVALTLLTDSMCMIQYNIIIILSKSFYGSIQSIPISKQMGGQDCCLFVITIATTLGPSNHKVQAVRFTITLSGLHLASIPGPQIQGIVGPGSQTL